MPIDQHLNFPHALRTRRNAYIRISCFILCALLVSKTASAAAGEDYLDISPEQLLGANVVSASKKSQTVFDSPAAVYVITREDIERSGVTTIPDALRMAPGVQVAQADSNSWAISIRGFNSALSNKLLVLIDGRTVYNPLYSGTYWEAQDVPLMDIDRIEVVRGPGGTLWGANAVNGVINIITRRAEDTVGNKATALVGTHDRGIFSARHGGRFGDDNYYRVYAKYFDRDPYKAVNPVGDNDGWESYRGGFRADWGSGFTLQGDVYRTLADQLDNLPTLVAPFRQLQATTVDYQGGNLLGRMTRRMSDGGMLTLQSYVDYAQREETPLLTDRRLTLDLESQYNFPVYGRHDVTVGGGYRYTRDDESTSPLVTLTPASRGDNLGNLFVQDKIELSPKDWYLTLGSKFEHNDYSGFEIEPSARVQWNMDEKQMMWAAVSRAVRTPSRLEQDITLKVATLPGAPPTQYALTQNKDFQSEELLAYEFGYRKQFTPAFSLDSTAFVNDYSQLGVFTSGAPVLVNNGIDPLHVEIPIWAENAMTGQGYGFELVGDWKVTRTWSLTATYSFITLDLHATKGLTPEAAEDMAPQNQVTLHSFWNIDNAWSLDTTLYYVDRLKQDAVSDYIRLDMNVGWKITDAVRLNLVGQNLLEGEHREFNNATSPSATNIGRSVYGKLTWKF